MRLDESLRYLAAGDVQNVPADAAVFLESSDGCELGRLDGFMVDPERHALRYYVVSRITDRDMTTGLVPFVPGCLDTRQGVLRLIDLAAAQPIS